MTRSARSAFFSIFLCVRLLCGDGDEMAAIIVVVPTMFMYCVLVFLVLLFER